MNSPARIIAAMATVLLLAGCTSTLGDNRSSTAQPTVTVTEMPEPAPTVTVTATPAPPEEWTHELLYTVCKKYFDQPAYAW